MEIPDNWLDVVCRGCELFYECQGQDVLCNCSNLLYDIMRVYEMAIEKRQATVVQDGSE